MPQNLSAKFVCPSPKAWDFDEKRFHWASVIRALQQLKDVPETARVTQEYCVFKKELSTSYLFEKQGLGTSEPEGCE